MECTHAHGRVAPCTTNVCVQYTCSYIYTYKNRQSCPEKLILSENELRFIATECVTRSRILAVFKNEFSSGSARKTTINYSPRAHGRDDVRWTVNKKKDDIFHSPWPPLHIITTYITYSTSVPQVRTYRYIPSARMYKIMYG